MSEILMITVSVLAGLGVGATIILVGIATGNLLITQCGVAI